MSSCPSLHRKFDPNTGYSQNTHQPPTPCGVPLRPTTNAKNSGREAEGLRGNSGERSSKEFMKPPSHNLQIQSYSFDEILNMFGLTYNISIDGLKAAKRKVLMVHPDKSNLPSEYFLFYKNAFEMVVQYYNNQTRQNQIVNENTSTDYVPIHTPTSETTHIRDTVEKMNSKQFHSRFNELFEQNMYEKPDETQNEWFRSDTAPSYIPSKTVSVSNMSSTFDEIKMQQRNAGLVRYSGVRELSTGGGMGSNYYDQTATVGNGNHNSEETGDEYVTSDPFSKLKFEDLRKVHKDQTVFAVSEREYDAMPKYTNVDQYSKQRNATPLTPMEKGDAQRIFDQREAMARERVARQQHYAELKSQEYAEKNKRVVGAFLHLTN
jgi:hypothetical protein